MTEEFIDTRGVIPSVHASTIEECPDGTLVAAWFGGLHEGHPEVAIYTSRRVNGVWQTPLVAARGQTSEGRPLACYNPVLFRWNDGSLLLFYKAGTSPQTWSGFLCTSLDSGRTWSPPRPLPDGILGPIKNRPVYDATGGLICPTSDEQHGWRVHFEFTKDLLNWRRTEPINDGKSIGAIQPSLLHLGGIAWRAIGRTQNGKLFQVDSLDDGRTWREMTLLDLPNPNSGMDAITLADGRYALAYNPVEKGRTPLVIATSSDASQWTTIATLEDKPGEYSYPSLLQTRDGHLHVVYTWKRKRIRHVELIVS